MALGATAAKLLASLDLDTKPFERGTKRVDGSLGKLEGRFGGVSTRAIALGSAVGVGIERLAERGIGFLFDQIRSGEEGLRVLQDTQAQTNAVIESTGGKAGVTAKQVRDLAEAQEALTTVDDKVVQSGENMLLTFTNIGGDIFPQATKAMVDMAVAMNGGNAEGIDLKNTSIQIGKALQDPIKGATALRRVGVQLTDQQEKQIKKFVESGDIMSAQKVILQELETEFGKAGEAAGTSGAAGIRRLNDAVEDSQITLATGLSPALDRIRGKIAKALGDPKTQEAIRHLGEWLGDAAESGLEFASSIPWAQVGDGLKTAAGFAGKLIDAFASMPPAVQGSILALAGLNKLSGGAVTGIIGELGKGLIKGVLGMNAGVVNINAGSVRGGGVGGAAGGGGGVAGVAGLAVAGAVAAQGAFDANTLINGIGNVVAAGDQKNSQGIIDAINTAADETVLLPPFVKDLMSTWTGLAQEQVDALKQPLDVKPQGLSPDERQAINDQRRKTQTLADKLESNRIATVTSRQAIVTGGHSDRNAIVTAIRGIRMQNSITIPVYLNGRKLTTLQQRTFLNRVGRNAEL